MADDETTGEVATATKPKKVKRNKAPSGQTSSGSGVTGGDAGDTFAKPTTRVDPLGVAEPTQLDSSGKAAKTVPTEFADLAKAMGHKKSDILSFNAVTRVVVFTNGGKYQLSKNGKALRHLAGPQPPSDLDLSVQDARQRSPFVGTAAAINGPAVVEDEDPAALRQRKAELQAELEAINETLGEEDDEEDEDE